MSSDFCGTLRETPCICCRNVQRYFSIYIIPRQTLREGDKTSISVDLKVVFNAFIIHLASDRLDFITEWFKVDVLCF